MKFNEALEKLNLGCTVALGNIKYRIVKEVLCQTCITSKERWIPKGFTREELASSEWRVIDYEPLYTGCEIVDFMKAMLYITEDSDTQGDKYVRSLATNRIYGLAVLNNKHTYLIGYNENMSRFEPLDIMAKEVLGKWEILNNIAVVDKLASTPIYYAPIDTLEVGLLKNNREKHARFIQSLSVE